MKILHFYHRDDLMIAQYATMLKPFVEKIKGLECDFICDEQAGGSALKNVHYDILHIHGCWRNAAAKLYKMAKRQGTRLVVSPHGQLEPWIMQDKFWKEKFPKRTLFQQSLIRQAYAVVIQGKMEESCMKHLRWNNRTVIVKNPVITSSITPEETLQQLYGIYRRVLDTYTLQRMDEETVTLLRQAIKAGITRDTRWLKLPTPYFPTRLADEAWRQLLCYAYQEQIEGIVIRGLELLGCDIPDFDFNKTNPFLPEGYKPSQGIQDTIGAQFTSENERLVATFRQIRKWILRGRFTIRHLCELDRELREYPCEEDQLADSLKDLGLYKTARRTMELAAQLTGLDEGFMPVTPLHDRATRNIKKQIQNHLKL